MEESTLYRLLEMSIMLKWRKEIEQQKSFLTEEVNQMTKIMLEALPEKDHKLLRPYSLALEDLWDSVHRDLAIKCLHLGVQIGLELQKPIVEE